MENGFRNAAEFRDIIRSIVQSEIKSLAPQPRLATVQRIDPDNNVCWVLFPGDSTPISVNITPGAQPRYAAYDVADGSGTADLVRVGGGPGGYYLMSVISSSAVNQVYDADIEALYDAVSSVPTTDGVGPAASPIIAVKGGIGSLALSFPAVVNADPVTVDIYGGTAAGVSTTGTPIASIQTNGPGVVFVRSVGGVTVVAGTTYYFKSVARDADNKAPASAESSGTPEAINSPDIAANAITTALLTANNAFIDALRASDLTTVTMTGALIQTDSRPQMGVKLGQTGSVNGLVAFGPAGDVFLSVDPAQGIAIVAGEVKATTLTVFSGASLGGVTEIASGGRVMLTGGTTPAKSAPTPTVTYDTFQFENDGNWAKRGGICADANYLYSTRVETTKKLWFEKWDLVTGKRVFNGEMPSDYLYVAGSVSAYLDNSFYRVFVSTTGNSYQLLTYTKDQLQFDTLIEWGDTISSTRFAAMTFDPTNNQYYIAQSDVNNGDKLRITRYGISNDRQSLTFVSRISTDFAYPNSLSQLLFGSFDFGAPRFVYSTRFSAVHRTSSIAATVYADQPNEVWGGVAGTTKAGFFWNGANFKTVDHNGVMTTWTSFDKGLSLTDPNLTKWVSSTLVKGAGPTFETPQSPRYKITMAKRARLVITTSAVSTQGGANDPDRVGIYTGSGAADPGRAGMSRQGYLAPGAVTATFASLSTALANPPAVSNFPGSAGSDLVANSGGFWVKDDSTGDVGTGSFRDSVNLAANSLNPIISVRRNAVLSVAASTEVLVPFDVADIYANTGASPITTAAPTATAIPITKAGLYRVAGAIAMNLASVTPTFLHMLAVNGVKVKGFRRGPGSPTTPLTQDGTRLIRLAAGDTIGLLVYHTHTAAVSTNGGTLYPTELQAEWIAP